jgi:hypothetical protein
MLQQSYRDKHKTFVPGFGDQIGETLFGDRGVIDARSRGIPVTAAGVIG